MQTQIGDVLTENGWLKKTWDADEFFMKIVDDVFMTLSISVKPLLAGYAVSLVGGWGWIGFNSIVQEVMLDDNYYPTEYTKFRLKRTVLIKQGNLSKIQL